MSNQLIDQIIFNQYEKYPSRLENGWKKYALLNSRQVNEQEQLIEDNRDTAQHLIKFSNSNWDYEHFGFNIAKITNPFVVGACEEESARYLSGEILNRSKRDGIKLIIARVNGDNITFLHALEDVGFRYYETIIWPVADLSKSYKSSLQETNDISVTYFDSEIDDIERVKDIAKSNQYQRGHFHCDKNLDPSKVNSLYSKWVQTAFENEKKIIIIKYKKYIVGYFICDIDNVLSECLGAKYGRFQSLAVDTSYRGLGLGRHIFEGAMSLLKSEGCQFIDSGYATKNHLSAKLHSDYGFKSVYEEVTMHLWL